MEVRDETHGARSCHGVPCSRPAASGFDARPSHCRIVLGRLVPPLVYVLAAFAYFRAAWGDPAARLIGGGSDPEQTIWTLGWPVHALLAGHNPWLTDHLDFPAGVNLMWTPTPFAPALAVAPVALAWGPTVAYDLLMTVGPALSAWTAFLAIHRLVGHRGAAFVGGLVYGFSPAVMAQELGHLGFVMAWWPLLVLLLGHELLVRRRWPAALTGGLLGLVGALQLYTSAELLATTALVASLGLVVLLGVAAAGRVPLGPPLRAMAVGGAVAVLVGLALGAPGLVTMFAGPQVVHGRLQPVDTYVTDVAGLVVPSHLRLVAPAPLAALTASFTGLEVEWDGYAGVALLVLLAVTAWRWWRLATVRWASVLALGVVVLSFGPRLHVLGRIVPWPALPWSLAAEVPVLTHALPSRVMVHFFLLAGLLLAVFVREAVVLGGRRSVARVGAAALVGLSLLLLAPMATPWVTEHAVPAFFTGPAVRRVPAGSAALVAPWADPRDATAMSWQAAAGYRYRMPEGYALHPGPDDRVAFGPADSATGTALVSIEQNGGDAFNEAQRREMACDLARWQVRTVVVGPMPHEADAVAMLTGVIGRPPERTAGVWVWWNVTPACAPG
jgi:hypothetical protein